MRPALIATVFFLAAPFLVATPALAVRLAVPVNMQIFDGPSGKLQTDRGTLIIDKFDEPVSAFRIQGSKGTVICSGTRRTQFGGGTFAGKCFGIDATGRYTQSLSGVVNMRWDFSNSWIKIRAKVQ